MHYIRLGSRSQVALSVPPKVPTVSGVVLTRPIQNLQTNSIFPFFPPFSSPAPHVQQNLAPIIIHPKGNVQNSSFVRNEAPPVSCDWLKYVF